LNIAGSTLWRSFERSNRPPARRKQQPRSTTAAGLKAAINITRASTPRLSPSAQATRSPSTRSRSSSRGACRSGSDDRLACSRARDCIDRTWTLCVGAYSASESDDTSEPSDPLRSFTGAQYRTRPCCNRQRVISRSAIVLQVRTPHISKYWQAAACPRAARKSATYRSPWSPHRQLCCHRQANTQSK
jgi:hypothetical protein